MKKLGQFVIVDTETGRFFHDDAAYGDWIYTAFTDSFFWAMKYEDKEKAKRDVMRFEKSKTEFDGNTPLKKGRLVVMQIALTPVE